MSEELEAEILNNHLEPGLKLPNEPELMSRFGVGRHTLRQAMANLETKGLVRIEQGRGTFVHDEMMHYQISMRTRFAQNLIEQGRDPSSEVLSALEVRPTATVAEMLKLGEDEQVYKIEILSRADDAIMCIADSYFSATRFKGMDEFFRADKNTTAAYKHFGIDDYVRDRTWISARLPTPDEARALHQPRSRPILVTRKVDTTLDGKPINFSETRWAADRIEFVLNGPELL